MKKQVALSGKGYLGRLRGVEIYFVKINFLLVLNFLIKNYQVYIYILDKAL